MNYLSLPFIIFFPAFLIIYYLVPSKYRYIAICSGSLLFYGFASPVMLLVLCLVALVSYFGGIFIGKHLSKAAYCAAFFAEILILVVFKYSSFLINNFNLAADIINPAFHIYTDINIILPVGLSFMVFQTCAYLSDIYNGRIAPEYNLIRYLAYVSFFPTVLSGPIQKARNLLPQLKVSSTFDYKQAQKGTLLFLWGAFEKILVANKLLVIVTRILDDYVNHSSSELLIAACSFSLYIYADFSAYSDMARGTAKLLGINVGRNFDNPYLSLSLSEFWTRWHTSLNEWFIENIYIPLGGSRKGTVKKYRNVFLVFMISGIWHGAQWHFIAWGILNGIMVISGQILKPLKQRVYDVLHVSQEIESIVLLKRMIVFFLITLTWVFFHSGLMDSVQICSRILCFDFISLFDPELLNIAGSNVLTFITMVMTGVFIGIQLKRTDEAAAFKLYCRQPFIFQCLIPAILLCICTFGYFSTGSSLDTGFLYFRF